MSERARARQGGRIVCQNTTTMAGIGPAEFTCLELIEPLIRVPAALQRSLEPNIIIFSQRSEVVSVAVPPGRNRSAEVPGSVAASM